MAFIKEEARMEENIVENWLKTNEISIRDNSNIVDTHLYTTVEINPIVQRYGIYRESKAENISVGDIYGIAMDYQMLYEGCSENVIDELGKLFMSEGGEYNTRANSLLNIPKENIVNELAKSFIEAPIHIDEVEEGKYIVNGNGKHRYVLLRCLYLDELSKINPMDKGAIQKLNDKYRFPGVVRRIDLEKTYISMFLMTFGFGKIKSVYFDSTLLGKEGTEIELEGKGFFSNGTSIVTDDKLMAYISDLIRENQEIINEKDIGFKIGDRKHNQKVENIMFMRKIPEYFRNIPSFREFVIRNLSEVFLEESVKINTGIDIDVNGSSTNSRSISELNKKLEQKCDPSD